MTRIGRFAPSPTGPLHMGSLLTAVASYLDIKQQRGKWFIRIDDLDPPRQDPKAIPAILGSLEAHGLVGDLPVDYQSEHTRRYQAALDQLDDALFYCNCSRRSLANTPIYPGLCRAYTTPRPDTAIRLRVEKTIIEFTDQYRGAQQIDSAEEVGDFIVRRRDNLWAYNFASAIDDAKDVTDVVRGEDLFHVTPAQLNVIEKLDLPKPTYTHLPVLCYPDGTKLSKQTKAPALVDAQAPNNIRYAFEYLGLAPPNQSAWSVSQWLAWGAQNWHAQRIPSKLKPYIKD